MVRLLASWYGSGMMRNSTKTSLVNAWFFYSDYGGESAMDDLLFAPATALAAAIQAKTFSAQEVIGAYLDRIQAINPALNAVVQLAADAMARARQADADLAQGIVHGPLHGVPFSVKDIFETVGCISPIDTQLRRRVAPVTDATVVARLRAAGAILLAKTNCPPNGNGSDTENTVTGRTLNPYGLDATPGGSSGGEAALIAVGAIPFGVGSDLSGGIRIPAHYCGVACLKPTSGRVPHTGAYNLPGGLTDPRSQIGPLARTVDDLALVLPLIAGVDMVDSSVTPMPWHEPAAVRPATLRVAYFTEDPASKVTHETQQAVGAAAQALARAGVELTIARPPDFIEAARQIDELWQDRAGAPGRTLVELYALWDYYRSTMLYFMADYDAILCPVDHHAAPPYRERDNRRFDYTIPFNLTGYPVVVVRVGRTANGLPIGVQVAARPWQEDVALALARSLEKELGGWQPSPL
jgi:amidase